MMKSNNSEVQLNWASEAIPTLGCSIKSSRDIYYVGLSKGKPYKIYVCQNVWEKLCGPNTRMLKVRFGRLKQTCDTHIIYFYYTLEQL